MTLLDISNMALNLLSTREIQSLDGNDQTTKLLNKWAPVCYEDAIRTYQPNFCTTKETLYYNHIKESFQLPTDYVLIVSASVDEYQLYDTNLIVKGSKIGDTIEIEYITNKQEKIQFASASFAKALAYTIASTIAYALTKDAQISNAMEAQAKVAWRNYNYGDNAEKRPSRVTTGLKNTSTWTRR